MGLSEKTHKIWKKFPHALDKFWIDELSFKYYSNLAVRGDKKSPNQETDLGNRGCLKVLNDTKLVLND